MWLAAGILALFVFQAWLVGIGDTGTRLRSFLLPLLTAIALGSGLGVCHCVETIGQKVILICARTSKLCCMVRSTPTSKRRSTMKAPRM